jgi:hypothetical protein
MVPPARACEHRFAVFLFYENPEQKLIYPYTTPTNYFILLAIPFLFTLEINFSRNSTILFAKYFFKRLRH